MQGSCTPRGAGALRPGLRFDRGPMTWAGMNAFVSAVCLNTVPGRQKGVFQPADWSDPLRPEFRGK